MYEMETTNKTSEVITNSIDNNYTKAKSGEDEPTYIIIKQGEYSVATNLLSVKAQTKAEQIKDIVNAELLPLARNQLNLLSAKGGDYKTFVALRSAMHFTAKEDTKVLCIFTEDTIQQVANRIHSLAAYEPAFDDAKLNVISIDEFAPDNVDEIIKLMDKTKEEVGLIILDPLLAFYEDDENDNTRAKKFMNKLAKSGRKNNTTLLILHHSAKGVNNSRGASAFTDACRVVYHRSTSDTTLAKDKADGTATFELYKDNIGVEYLTGKSEFNVQVINGTKHEKL